MRNKFFTKNESVRTCGAHPHLRGVHARTRTHISEKNSAPICTKIAAPARVRARPHSRTLKVYKLETTKQADKTFTGLWPAAAHSLLPKNLKINKLCSFKNIAY